MINFLLMQLLYCARDKRCRICIFYYFCAPQVIGGAAYANPYAAACTGYPGSAFDPTAYQTTTHIPINSATTGQHDQETRKDRIHSLVG